MTRSSSLGGMQQYSLPQQDQRAAPDPIDLRIVHGYLNSMSGDQLRQLHDKLAILNMVAQANDMFGTFRAQVRQVLANAGVRFNA